MFPKSAGGSSCRLISYTTSSVCITRYPTELDFILAWSISQNIRDYFVNLPTFLCTFGNLSFMLCLEVRKERRRKVRRGEGKIIFFPLFGCLKIRLRKGNTYISFCLNVLKIKREREEMIRH
jgi:hypothetical protein